MRGDDPGRAVKSRTGRTWRSCSRTLTGPTTYPGSGRLGRKRRPGYRRNCRSRPRSRWPDRAAPPYGSGAGDESSAPFFLEPPCDGRVSTITCFAPIVKLPSKHEKGRAGASPGGPFAHPLARRTCAQASSSSGRPSSPSRSISSIVRNGIPAGQAMSSSSERAFRASGPR